MIILFILLVYPRIILIMYSFSAATDLLHAASCKTLDNSAALLFCTEPGFSLESTSPGNLAGSFEVIYALCL